MTLSTDTNPSATAKRLPDWLTNHFSSSLDAHDKLMQIARLSEQGIRMHLGVPNAIRALAKAKNTHTETETEKRIQFAEQDAALARREIDDGFPVLHGFVTIALWSWMEEFTKGLVACWFQHRPSSMRVPTVQKLKVRLGDYIQLSRAEQGLFLVELLEQEIASPLKSGVDRFNTLLETIHIHSTISSERRKSLFELQKVRNNLAHRSGRADRRLIAECPWLKYKVGQQVNVDLTMLRAYFESSAEFLLHLLFNVGDTHGIDLRPASEVTPAAPNAARP